MHICLVTDQGSEAQRFTQWICDGLGPCCTVDHVPRLDDALAQMREGRQRVDVLIVDLLMPPNPAQLCGLTRAQAHAPLMAIIVVSDLEAHDVVQTAIRNGAQEFLVKSTLTPERLAAVIMDAVAQRQRWQERVKRFEESPTVFQQAVILCELSQEAVAMLTTLARARGQTTKVTLEDLIAGAIPPDDPEP